MARVLHAAAPGLAVRAVLSAERRVHHARVPRAPLQSGRARLLHVGVDHRLRADQNQRHPVRRRHRDARSDGVQCVDQRRDPDRHHRDLHGPGRPARRDLHGGDAGGRADHRVGDHDGAGPTGGGRMERPRGARAGGLLLYVEADESSELPLDGHHLWRADPGRLVLVHRPAHRAAGARGPDRERGPHRQDLRRVPEDPAGVHLRAAGHHRRGAVCRHPGRGRRCGVPRAGDPAPPGRVQGPGARGDARRADELARVRVQLLLHPAHVGRVPQAPAQRERAATGGGRAAHHGRAGGAGPALDPVHEVRLAADLHLPAERAGLHRTTHRGVLPAWRAVPEAERNRRVGRALDRARDRDGPTRARARAGQSGQRLGVGLVRRDQLPPLRGPAVRAVLGDAHRRPPDDRPALTGPDRGRGLRGTGDRGDPGPGRPAELEHRPLGCPRGHDRGAVDRVQVRPFGRLVEVGGGWWRLLPAVSAACIAATSTTCKPSTTLHQPTAGALFDPAADLGALFQDVQLSGIFADSKTFVDARPLLAPAEIAARYAAGRTAAGFSLQAFVAQHFELPRPVGEGFHTDTSQTMEAHIRALWPVLTRRPDTVDPRSSLIPLPNPYVVPGGRFREVYYWDSYFTMLGLIASGRTDLVKSMLDNFAHLIGTVGHIPNGNRTYYLSRSQPPV